MKNPDILQVRIFLLMAVYICNPHPPAPLPKGEGEIRSIMKAILVINSGSSTIKFSVFSITDTTPTREYNGLVDRILMQPTLTIESCKTAEKITEEIAVFGEKETYYKQAIEAILRWVVGKGFELVAAGHRIVHGGPEYTKPVVLDKVITKKLLDLTPIMPLHQPYNVKGIEILSEELPNLLQVGCFDTMFHATCNPISQQYAIPNKFTEAGIKRYGFHGLSYEYIASQLPKYMSEKEANGKFVVAHLGNGSTMCAIEKQKSVATSIGFTGLGGLPMATRCDSIDPGAVLYLLENYGYNTEQLRNFFYKECGLLGVSGVSSDMRDLLASDKPEAKLAIDIYVHRIYIMTGQLVAELQGLDGFIFTAGIGENAAPVREQVCNHLTWLGVSLDKEKNKQKIKEAAKISSAKSQVPVWVIPTDEELMIAKHTLNLYKQMLTPYASPE
jgi:acetate kinase